MRGNGPDSEPRDARESGAALVDAYIADLPPDKREALQSLRATIRAAAPDAEECISYSMPAFRHKGMLVYYAAFKNHCSLFPASSRLIEAMAEELKDFVTSKGTIQFTPDRPLPKALVTKMVKARLAENEAKKGN